MGHSWGSILGVHLVTKSPDLFEAYIGVGQAAYNWMSAKEAYRFSTLQAWSDNDVSVLEDLKRNPPYSNNEIDLKNVFSVTQYVIDYGGSVYSKYSSHSVYLYDALFESPDYTDADWECWFLANGSGLSEKLLYRAFNKSSDIANLHFTHYEFNLPVLFVIGDRDVHASSRVSMDYFLKLKAPRKELRILKNIGRFPMMEDPDRFLDVLISFF